MHGNNKHAGIRAAARIGLALAAMAAVTGCQAVQEADDFIERNWVVESHMYPPERTAINVRTADTAATLAFAPGSAALTTLQRDAIGRFVSGSGARRGDRAVVGVGPAQSRGLAERRAQAVAAQLRRYGLQVARTAGPGAPDTATITVTRVVALAPDCPEWNELVKRNLVNENKPSFGCLNASSLAASVHQPQDIIAGRRSGPSDGPTLDRGVQLLREGKFDPPTTPVGTGSPQSQGK